MPSERSVRPHSRAATARLLDAGLALTDIESFGTTADNPVLAFQYPGYRCWVAVAGDGLALSYTVGIIPKQPQHRPRDAPAAGRHAESTSAGSGFCWPLTSRGRPNLNISPQPMLEHNVLAVVQPWWTLP
jgi:hypothetical protein